MLRPLSIAFITGQLGLGGAEKQLCLLVEGLLQISWQVIVLTLNPGKGDYWERRLDELKIPVISIPRGLPWRRMLLIARRLKEHRIRLVHAWVFHANPYANLSGRLAGVSVRLGSIREHPNHWPDSHLLRVTGLVGLDGIVVNSQAAVQALDGNGTRYRSPLYMVHNAVATPALDHGESLRLRLAETWHLLPQVPWLIALGRLDQNKNWEVLLQACRGLVGQGLRFHLVFIGEGAERTHLEIESAKLSLSDCIRFVGLYPQAKTILPAFDLLCLPSRSEGLPNAVMEASAAGLPIVGTAVGGMPEVVDDGLTGFLVPTNDVGALAGCLKKLLVDAELRRRMGQAGREKMQREFSVERMLTRMLAVYEDVLRVKAALPQE